MTFAGYIAGTSGFSNLFADGKNILRGPAYVLVGGSNIGLPIYIRGRLGDSSGENGIVFRDKCQNDNQDGVFLSTIVSVCSCLAYFSTVTIHSRSSKYNSSTNKTLSIAQFRFSSCKADYYVVNKVGSRIFQDTYVLHTNNICNNRIFFQTEFSRTSQNQYPY